MASIKRKDVSPTSSAEDVTESKKPKTKTSSCDSPLSGTPFYPDEFKLDLISEEAREEVSNDPAFKQLVQYLRPLYDASAKDIQFDRQAYAAAKKQVVDNQDLMEKIFILRDAMMKEPFITKESETRLAAFLAKVCSEDSDSDESRWTDKEVLQKICEILLGTNHDDSGSDGEEECKDEAEESDAEDESDAHRAAVYGDMEALMTEIQAGRIRDLDKFKRTPLHLACVYGQFKCARALIDAGLDVNAGDMYKNTPLHYAALNGETNCVILLLSYKADQTENIDGNKPKYIAERAGYNDIVQALDDCGYSIK